MEAQREVEPEVMRMEVWRSIFLVYLVRITPFIQRYPFKPYV
jgi:hypothetical protein